MGGKRERGRGSRARDSGPGPAPGHRAPITQVKSESLGDAMVAYAPTVCAGPARARARVRARACVRAQGAAAESLVQPAIRAPAAAFLAPASESSSAPASESSSAPASESSSASEGAVTTPPPSSLPAVRPWSRWPGPGRQRLWTMPWLNSLMECRHKPCHGCVRRSNVITSHAMLVFAGATQP